MNMRRVVVTGLGLVTPLACGVSDTWARLLDGQSGAGKITRFDPDRVTTKYACEVPFGDGSGGTFNPDDWMEPKERRKVDDFILYGIAASEMAVRYADWKPTEEAKLLRTGVMIGSGIGGLNSIAETAVMINERGPKRISPFFIPSSLINLLSGHISIKYNLKGPNSSPVTACATGTHAIGDSFTIIKNSKADLMVCGGAEAAICPLGISGFSAARALCDTFNEYPEKGSRPWDKDRSGFVMGEGAGVLVLEELEHAKKRNAKIYGEVKGYGMSGDAFHITKPSEDGNGGYRAMKMALDESQLNLDEIEYVNAHGTSTQLGDTIELNVVEKLFKSNKSIFMSSNKSAIGHLLGAAGAVEAVFSFKTLETQTLPPTLNLDNPDTPTKINLIPHESISKAVKNVISNSFGFGGTNASLVFGH